ncbi:MarR family transcriptional regulator [Clostridium gelidum]|uniref:MarR family transcriptional regulator n=1 Tax=Clostridium gelidum TaxID=704125 RepID=A0ABM7T4K6_9CLOT|nr:MarR family transcriptional regulator [Clostridium gelidum]BCZ46228.1 MarR family transcriptional regulator [Clostridium gelidum]
MDKKYESDKDNNYKTNLNLSTLIVLTRAEQKIHKIEYETIKAGGLTNSQFAVLEVLYSKGDLKICEIIEKILTTSGNVTVVIKNLEKDGLVSKNSDPEDKRSILISITDKGKKIMDEIFPKHVDNINSIFDILTIEEKLELKKILKKFRDV